MAQMTYRKFAELIGDRHYAGFASDDATISLRHIAELVAAEVAWAAKKNAFENSNLGESTYTNDQFISVWNNLALQTDSITKEKYVTLPATPAGLPNNQEVSSVAFTTCPNYKAVPLKQKDTFAQQFLDRPNRIYNYKIENGRVVFIELPNIVTGVVSLKLVGAVSGDNLLDSVLQIPKDVEVEIMDRVLLKLMPGKNNVPRDVINDSQSIPA